MFDVKTIRKDFPMIQNNKGLIYFDNAATSFKPKCVIDKVVNYYEFNNSNIHRGDYDLSYRVSKDFEDTRDIVKDFINADSSKEIVFTSGDTQSLNMVAHGYACRNLKKGDYILTSYVEHASNILPWFRVCEKTGCGIVYSPLNNDGTFNLTEYEKCFDIYNIKIVCLTYVSNVLGYIYPIKDIVRIAHNHNAIVSIDGAQALPHFRIDVKDLDVDFLSFSAHKMLGPDGVGVLYGKYLLLNSMDPLILGGGANARFYKDGEVILKNAPYKFEAGTNNIEGVLGLGEAIMYLNRIGMDNISEYTDELVKYLVNKLSKLDNVEIINANSECGIVAFNIKGVFAQDAASYISKNNICVRAGNHCAKIIDNVIGTTDTIRASLYFYNTKEEIDKFIDVIKDTTLENAIGVII